MSDFFLLQHKVQSLIFDIGGDLYPASIKDQMIRGRIIVDRAIQAGLIGPTRDLLVIGAGAAGATASIHAALHGVKTVLIDKHAPFSLQRGCTTRFLNPTQYDWPINHWEKAIFPWQNTPNMSLPWKVRILVIVNAHSA